MINGFLQGIFSYFDAYTFLKNHKLGKYYWISGLFGMVILLIISSSVVLFSDDISAWILSLFKVEIEWIHKVSSFLVGIIVFGIFFIIYKYLVLMITAPLMSKLSEEIESILEGDNIEIPFSLGKIIKDFFRALRLSIRNIIREIGLTLILLILGLIPIFSIGAAPAIFLIQAFYAGFGNIDFFAERHYNVKETIRFVKDNKGLAAGNGTLYVLILSIPIIGVFFAPALGATAATLEAYKRKSLLGNN